MVTPTVEDTLADAPQKSSDSPTLGRSYGDYIARGSYISGAMTSVDIAVSTKGTGSYALKRFHPPLTTRARPILQREAWALSMDSQRRVAKDGGPALEVHTIGWCLDCEYAVLSWNRRSLASLAHSVSPTGDQLRAFALNLFTALNAWEQRAGRPHGNLKPSNIFLSGHGPLQSLHYLLSDPAWSLALSNDQLRRQELAQVGTLIVQLLRRREGGSAQIEDGPEWNRLGRTKAAWRDYCNFLRDPSVAGSTLSRAAALARLDAIPRDRRPGRLALRTVATTAVTGCCLTLACARFGDPRWMPTSLRRLPEAVGNKSAKSGQPVEEWYFLCRAWNHWAADLVAQSSNLERRKKLWDRSDSLPRKLADFRRASTNYNPRQMVRKWVGLIGFAELESNPPFEAGNYSVQAESKDAWKALLELSSDLQGWSRWPLLRSLRDQLATAGKNIALRSVRPLAPDPLPPMAEPNPTDFVVAFTLFAQDPEASAVLEEWSQWTGLEDELKNSHDRVQAAMPSLALLEIADANNLSALAQTLAASRAMILSRVARFRDQSVAHERMLDESPLLAERGEITSTDLERWENEVRRFSFVAPKNDPRVAFDWESRLDTLRKNAENLEAEIPTEPRADGLALLDRNTFDREEAKISREVSQLRRRIIVEGDLTTMRAETDRAVERLQSLEKRMEITMAFLSPERWLQRVQARSWADPALRERWEHWLRGTVNTVTISALNQDRARFRRLRKDESVLRGWLEAAMAAAGDASGSEVIKGSLETQRALSQLKNLLRGETMSRWVNTAEWVDSLPRSSFSEALQESSTMRHDRDEFEKWKGELSRFASDLEQVRDALTRSLSWKEGLADCLAATRRHRGVERLEGEPQRWLEAAREVEEVALSSEIAMLSEVGRTEGLAKALTAWSRLGEIAAWPSSPNQLETEKSVSRRLLEAAGKLPPGTRRDTLLASLSTGRNQRWVRAARGALKAKAHVDEIFVQAQEFGVESHALEPAIAYDLSLWRLQRMKSQDLAELRSVREAFLVEVGPLLPPLNQRAPELFLKALQSASLDADTTESRSPTPAKAGWKEELRADGQSVTTSWVQAGHEVDLEYQLVQPIDGSSAFFLARRAVAIKEFVDLLSYHLRGREVWADLPPWVRTASVPEPNDFVASWKVRDDKKGLELAPSWLLNPGPQLSEALRDPSRPAWLTDRPSDRSPVQNISATVARSFAEKLLGARLPQPREWALLSQSVPVSQKGYFRSALFVQLWNFAKRGVGSPRVPLYWRPSFHAFPDLSGRTDERDDGGAWLGGQPPHEQFWPATVDEGPEQAGVINLFGNVWTYLHDPSRNEFYVGGGSIFMPPFLGAQGPREPQPLPRSHRIGDESESLHQSFSDVGLRPAFNASEALLQRLAFVRLINAQVFVEP